MSKLETLLEELRLCKATGDNEKLQELFTDLDLAVLEVDSLPSNFFQGVLELQQDAEFRRLDNSWTLLYFLHTNWEQLTPEQRDELRSVLNDGFDKYQNWMGAFVTSEILGERYADEMALNAMEQLAGSARLPARAAIPHGLETLAKTTDREALRESAIRRLKELEKSDSEEVRQEAAISLKKLGRK